MDVIYILDKKVLYTCRIILHTCKIFHISGPTQWMWVGLLNHCDNPDIPQHISICSLGALLPLDENNHNQTQTPMKKNHFVFWIKCLTQPIYWFCNDWCIVMLSCVSFATPGTAAFQAPLSMEFFRQEYWSRLPWLIVHFLERSYIDSFKEPQHSIDSAEFVVNRSF